MNANSTFSGFDDLGDDFDNQPVTVNRPETVEAASGHKSIKSAGELFEERCPRCHGSGRYNAPSSLGHQQCLKCKGKGKLFFKKSKDDRAKARTSAAKSKEAKGLRDLEAFELANPDIAAWWSTGNPAGDSSFSSSLRQAVIKWGQLTPNQHAAALRCIEAIKGKKAAAAEREVHAQSLGHVDVSGIAKALKKAGAAGLKNPKIRLLAGEQGIIVYNASAHGNNAGSLYVKSSDNVEYFGKITDGKFYRGRGVSDELETNIVKACSTPAESAVAYGRITGSCSCCGRELTDPKSIELGIGPICLGKFF